MTEAHLAELTREELIGLVLAQADQLARLQVIIEQLQADNEVLRVKLEKLQKPPTSSRNSSQPPSRDQKRLGRSGSMVLQWVERHFVAEPDQIVPLRVTNCPVCQTDLQTAPAVLVDVTQITEIPEPQA